MSGFVIRARNCVSHKSACREWKFFAGFRPSGAVRRADELGDARLFRETLAGSVAAREVERALLRRQYEVERVILRKCEIALAYAEGENDGAEA